MNDIKADSFAIQKYWLGKKIKHLDSEPYLGTPMYTLFHVKDVAKKTLKAESDFPVRALKHLGKFLRKCKYVSDRDLFDKTDYWQLPDQFEKNRKGDCEDFSLWSWRKFLDLGEDARFTYGSQDGGGHSRYQRGWFVEMGVYAMIHKRFALVPKYRFHQFPNANTWDRKNIFLEFAFFTDWR